MRKNYNTFSEINKVPTCVTFDNMNRYQYIFMFIAHV